MEYKIKYNIKKLSQLEKEICGKKKFNTEADIRQFLNGKKAKGLFGYSQVNIYQCPFCKKFHFGSAKL